MKAPAPGTDPECKDSVPSGASPGPGRTREPTPKTRSSRLRSCTASRTCYGASGWIRHERAFDKIGESVSASGASIPKRWLQMGSSTSQLCIAESIRALFQIRPDSWETVITEGR